MGLLIQTLNNWSDERTEYLINDRLSFMRFLGPGLSERVPDAKTVWLFRKRLTQTDAINGLFNRFDAPLGSAGYLPMSGQILNTPRVTALKPRNTNAEKNNLRQGRLPEHWQDDGTILAIPVFGYKSHISIDRKFRFIRKWKTTDAAASDGARLRD